MNEIIEESLFFNVEHQKNMSVNAKYSLTTDSISTIAVTLKGLTEEDEEMVLGSMTILCIPKPLIVDPFVMQRYSKELSNIACEVRKDNDTEENYFVLEKILVQNDFRCCGYGTIMMENINRIITELKLSDTPTIVLVASAFERAEKQDYNRKTKELCKFYEKMGFTCLNEKTRVYIKKKTKGCYT